MRRLAYIKLCELQDTEWLKETVKLPSKYLTRTHVLLAMLELRRRGELKENNDET